MRIHFQKTGVKLVAAFTLLTNQTWAGSTPFLIKDRSTSLTESAPAELALKTAIYDSADRIQAEINSTLLKESTRQDFSDAIAAANASAASSLNADRASNPGRLTFGGGAKLQGYSKGSQSFLDGLQNLGTQTEIPTLGLGVQAAVTAGFKVSTLGLKSLGPISTDRLFVYLSGFAFSTTVSGLNASMSNFGANLQYKLLPSVGSPWLAQWGGLHLGTGLNYASNQVDYSSRLPATASTSDLGSGVTATVSTTAMDYTLGVKSSTFTIPFEASTSATIFHLFTLYGGGALDLNFGSSQLIGTASGSVSATTNSPVATANLFSGTASLDLNDGVTGKPTFLMARGFLGAQFNIFVFKLAVEYTALGNGASGAAVMARFAL